MKPTAKLLALLALVLVVPASTFAQGSCEGGSSHAFLRLTTTQTPWDGCTVVMDPAPTIVTVVAGPHVPMTKVRFSIQDPSFGVILDATWDYPFVGTPETGVEITLPECTSGPTTVLGQMLVFATDISAIDGACVEWTVDDGAEIEDCTGAVRPAEARHHEFSTAAGCCSYIDCASIPPYDLYPQDGAKGVPIDAVLSWTGGYGYFDIYISDDPTCYTGQAFHIHDAYSFAPDFLEHNTTYYWQVGWSDGLECGGTSPQFSFTTMGPVPTETTNWGRIKALYR